MMSNKRRIQNRMSNILDPRWPPGRRRSCDTSLTCVYKCLQRCQIFSSTVTRLSIFFILLTLVSYSEAICPSKCTCNNVKLEVTCQLGNLEVVPIQLNPEVKKLMLSNNKITSIHQTLSFYTNLQYLDVSINRIRTLGAKNFELQADLLFLNLSDNQITKLSKDSFKGLNHLQILDLSCNRLEDISEHDLKDLQQLQELLLSKNQITTIDVTIATLKRLDLSDNQLLKIPNFSHNLTKLAELDLAYNLIEHVHEGAIPMNIEYLNLRSNVLRNVNNNSMNNLFYLEYLDLSDNNLTKVPREINKLLNLKFLNLSSNFFYFLKFDSFINLFQLNEIYLDNLPLYNIDTKVFLHNINLNVISLSDNDLSYLPNRLFHHNLHLKHLFLYRNRFSTLYADDLRLDTLKSLKISHNPFTCNCTLLWLYILKEKQSDNTSINGSLTADDTMYPVIIDFDHVFCHDPPHLHHILFKQLDKSDLNCDLTYYIILIISLLLLFILFVVLIVVYVVRYKKGGAKNQCDQYIEAAKHYEDMNRTYYNYSKPNMIDLLQNSEKSNMYVSRPSIKDLKTFNNKNSIQSESSSYSLNLSKNDIHIYQEPIPIYNNKRPPNIVYV